MTCGRLQQGVDDGVGRHADGIGRDAAGCAEPPVSVRTRHPDAYVLGKNLMMRLLAVSARE
jgi:hypothetical protein